MLQVTFTTVRVLPLEEDKVPKDGAVKEGQDLALQAVPLKIPLVPHVQVPPPLYPASQVTVTTAPVVPVILEEVALSEKIA